MWTGAGLYDRFDHRLTEWRLHPLIHTSAPVNLAQSVVAGSQEQECGLKYVAHYLCRFC